MIRPLGYARINMYFKYIYNLSLQKIFKFESWHLSSIDSRPYCLDLVDYINSVLSFNSTVVEVGCGLGENLIKIKSKNKIGFDISRNVIKAAKFKYFFHNVQFEIGSLENIKDLNIDFLIAVNFLHDYYPKDIESQFEIFLSRNRVDHILLDIIDREKSNNYKFYHDFEFLKKNFFLSKKISNNYNFGRSIIILTRKKNV